MATVNYRCEVDPEGCGVFPDRGYCPKHVQKLIPERSMFVASPPEPEVVAQADTARPEVWLRLLGRDIRVPEDGLPLGREEGPLADLPGMAELTQVSRTHARLYWVGAVLYVADGVSDGVPSTNGTFVDGEKVVTPRRIAPGQELRLGLDVSVDILAVDLDEYGLPR
ncbi:FHA domain-containing protein [Umezawaea sp. Da 62-37]|uniref:FHA domain-containing protein n=1 Tax=Umezawaea sp. Da 62-37 TaxID=3075927 RepID=UPI0028F7222D|nr:FHA domain-containing protein [Umezawaea sp. Da 62-37]WNV85321.1 FHA domain-containing protein [Umezawaea sp. Da 62-37]